MPPVTRSRAAASQPAVAPRGVAALPPRRPPAPSTQRARVGRVEAPPAPVGKGGEDDARAMMHAKAFYALSSGSLAFILPFLNVYLTSHGLTAAQIGILAAVRPAVGAPAAAAVAAAADATGRHRAVLGVCFVAAALGRLAIPLAPGDFAVQIGLAVATEAVAAPVQVIADAAVVAAAPPGDGYGRARLWGAVGWGALSLGAGWLVAARGVEAGFAAYAAAAAFALAPTLLLPVGALASSSSSTAAPPPKGHPPSTLATRVAALLTPRAACFYGLAVCLGFAASVTASYLPLYLHDALGGSTALLGAAIAVACAAELPVFYHASALTARFGPRRVLDVAAAAFAVRLLGYTVAGRAWGPVAVIPLEALHGLAFAGAWAAGTEHCASLAPPGLKSTAQSLFSAAYMGVGAGAGALVGGALYQNGGPDACFQGSATALIVGWTLLSVAEAALVVEEEDSVRRVVAPRRVAPPSLVLASSDE